MVNKKVNKEEFDFIAGEVLLFDKPLEWTSFGLVSKVRKLICTFLEIKKIKIGHAGTLDPLACGLMILCSGKKTKTIEQFQGMEKEYIATIRLGETTPSFDLETEIDAKYATNHIDFTYLTEAVKTFTGKMQQVPPVFSAKKVNGVRAYTNARKGKTIELKPSEIEIFNMEILDFTLPDVKLKINCSKGTYIRSIARDLGIKLNSGAHLTALQRTKTGGLLLDEAYSLQEFADILQLPLNLWQKNIN